MQISLSPAAVLPRGLERRRTWQTPPGAALALLLSALAQSQQRLLMAVTRDAFDAHQLELDLQSLAPASVQVLHFPDWETLAYDLFSPHPDLVSQRIATLAALPGARQQASVLVVPIQTLLQRLAPLEFIVGSSFQIRCGQKLVIDAERQRMDAAGYRSTKQVLEPGDYAVRGGLLDIFPMGTDEPYRIELLDDEVETIRTFDVETQRSTGSVREIKLLPAREFPFDTESARAVRQKLLDRFSLDPRRSALYMDLKNQVASPGIEYYLPMFFKDTVTLFDYIGSDAMLVLAPNALDAADSFLQLVEKRFDQRAHDIERPILPVPELYLTGVQLREQLNLTPRIVLSHDSGELALSAAAPPQLTVHRKDAAAGADLQAYLKNFDGRVLIAADSAGRRESLRELLGNLSLAHSVLGSWSEFLLGTQRLALAVAPLTDGFVLPDAQIAVLTERQLYGERAKRERKKKGRVRDPASIIRDLGELAIGAPVVHEDSGVGRYLGLQTLTLDGMVQEFIALEYAGGDKLYVPVSNLDVISRYTGTSPESAPLHSLSGDAWERAKKRAAQRARDVSAELLEIYAKRQARIGVSIKPDRSLYDQFAAAFPFEETPDQQSAIEAVLEDLRQSKPMDRLVCGDVGFGKTEVALRAAFAAASAGKQVALLVPTTLLAQQHYQNFSDRFADWPVRVEMLSRFRSKKEVAETLKKMESGAVDVVIGTHKLLSDDIHFRDLGLVIVDEEQRFGVRDKERLKKLRAEVDMLTLTATPIPRTLNFALSGLRDLSIIATPPKQRVAVKTIISVWDSAVLREAFEREFSRGGQVYFLHNEVDTIEKAARELQELVPQARLAIAHGQMPERELEAVMLDFYRQRSNVLVCSTIIESGIDVPNANTIIIQRADKFGLAQLHQLRGRVGRSHHRAFAYLIVPPGKAMTLDAEKRLQAIASLEELGAGFTLATHDLEIRGAGELLGEEQSGQIAEVGFSLYTELLERAVKALKEGKIPDLDTPRDRGADINLHVSTRLPEDFLADVHERLVMYKRISSCTDLEQLRELKIETIDRFGLLPEPAEHLFQVAALKLQATALGIKKLDLGPQGGRVLFKPKPNINAAAVLKLIQTEPKHFGFEGSDKLKLRHTLPEAAQRFALAQSLLEQISPKASPKASA
jgi:transcription-repair coupling factor (superfamily II helicase)